MRGEFGSVRDQGPRPTCLAFAASDTHAAIRSGWDPLSCEYIFFHAQRRTGRSPDQGAFLHDILASLEQDGQPRESGWPYLSALPSDLSLYQPPVSVGDLYGRVGEQQTETVDQVFGTLKSGTPSIVLTKLTNTFFRPPATGVVDHVDGDIARPAPRHAVVAVGCGRLHGGRVVHYAPCPYISSLCRRSFAHQ